MSMDGVFYKIHAEYHSFLILVPSSQHPQARPVWAALLWRLAGLSCFFFPCFVTRLVEAKDGETAGALMTFFLALGLSLGAAVSFPLRALV